MPTNPEVETVKQYVGGPCYWHSFVNRSNLVRFVSRATAPVIRTGPGDHVHNNLTTMVVTSKIGRFEGIHSKTK